ncbi:hypothetical protein CSA56_04750 [candidate division KSB3 bacterium]|uniref:Uncharacterized protein n=1 Tax=candidate division KSB3 bacterium TaxID=2044937 RepID=A0A2G6KHZ7_9BACT|nr:MAG: hypothetical protein CSA56_04750 [candidate division KSB3 bacterium]
MKKHSFTISSAQLYCISGIIVLLIVIYLFWVVRLLIAAVHYQQSIAATAQGVPTMTTVQRDAARRSLTTAIRLDGKNPRYHFAQGSFLFQLHSESSQPDIEQQQEKWIRDAESSLKNAIRLDPANAWNYYELARFKEFMTPCADIHGIDTPESCPSAKLFVQALHYAPNQLFLRNSVGLWLYYQDRETAFTVIRDVIARYTTNPQEREIEFSKFLYDMRLDYESDLHSSVWKESVGKCAGPIKQDQHSIELGSDDGFAEWRTYLASKRSRVKKVICLPETTEQYDYAALKIMMSHGGHENFIASIYIDDQPVQFYDREVPHQKHWYEIPFAPSFLRGKTFINVYIRVDEASYRGGNYLQIWGDQKPATEHSSRDYHRKRDLSDDRELQTGEFMIRLVLKKSP